MQSALKFESSKGRNEGETSNRPTISINTGLMWKILHDQVDARNRSPACGETIFDSSFLLQLSLPRIRTEGRRIDITDRGSSGDLESSGDEDDLVETQIFHHPNPATDVDISNGGQEFPPHSGAVARRTRSSSNFNHHTIAITERSTLSAPAAEQNLRGQEPNQVLVQQGADHLLAWPADDIWMSLSMIDVAHDPLFQIQDQDIPWAGSWEIGNL